MGYAQLKNHELDALREVSNIGMEQAATALSQLVGQTINMSVPRILLTDICQVLDVLGDADRMVVGIYLQILGNTRGNILIIFPRENAIKILEKILPKQKVKGAPLTDLEISALKEVGNILASAYLNALSRILKMSLVPSVPDFSFDMVGAVVDYVLISLAEAGDTSLMIETEFTGDGDPVSGHFFLLPDPSCLDVILKAVGV
ncbi:MAG: chemotaxis protein CheC [Geobacteraceae bacterium]